MLPLLPKLKWQHELLPVVVLVALSIQPWIAAGVVVRVDAETCGSHLVVTSVFCYGGNVIVTRV